MPKTSNLNLTVYDASDASSVTFETFWKGLCLKEDTPNLSALEIIDKELGEYKLLYGSSAPTSEVIGKKGQLYIETTTPKLYQYNGISWKEFSVEVDLTPYRKAADQDSIDNAIKTRISTIEGDYLKNSDKTELQDLITTEASARTNADNTLQANIDIISVKIPGEATSENQLADKAFVNSTVATETATFRGTSAKNLSEEQFLEWADSLTKTNNDYIFWDTIDTEKNVIYKRYKYSLAELKWKYEYTLNNSSFTSTQWAAINSGITSEGKEKLDDLVKVEANPAISEAQQLSSIKINNIDYKIVSGLTSVQFSNINGEPTDNTKLSNALSDKQNILNENQLLAVNSGITSAKVNKLDGIAEGAEVNVITTIKIGDTSATISERAATFNSEVAGALALKDKAEKTDLADSLQTEIDSKQESLISGTNIKTINNQSILGAGNLEIASAELPTYPTFSADKKYILGLKPNEAGTAYELYWLEDTIVRGE